MTLYLLAFLTITVGIANIIITNMHIDDIANEIAKKIDETKKGE